MNECVNSDPVLAWQIRNLPALKRLPLKAPCSHEVTLFSYWLWVDKRFDALLDSLLAAILMSWHACGRLPVVLVVNRVTLALQQIADEWGIRLHIEPNVRGGGGHLRDINKDWILNLASRFDTEYVLTFQNHAFPLHAGLENFLGTYDYIGAPWVFGKDDWITRFLLPNRHDVGNGGFALRSRRLCEMESWYYRRKYKFIPQCYLVIDDYFICKTLPSWERKYREIIRIAPPEVAATFALEDNIELHTRLKANPFGFHGSSAFQQLLSENKISEIQPVVEV